MPRMGNSIYHRENGFWKSGYVKSIDAFEKKKCGSAYMLSVQAVNIYLIIRRPRLRDPPFGQIYDLEKYNWLSFYRYICSQRDRQPTSLFLL